MDTAINIRSTDKNWIVSIHRTNAEGQTAIAPLATMPRRAYSAIALAAVVKSAQKAFLADEVTIETDMLGVEMLAALELIDQSVFDAAKDRVARAKAKQEA